MDNETTVYEFNQSVYSQLPKLTSEELIICAREINKFFGDNKANYYIILNNELHYYTILVNKEKQRGMFTLGTTIIDCLKSCGDIINIEPNYVGKVVEAWVKNGEKINCYMIFNYEAGVVEFYE